MTAETEQVRERLKGPLDLYMERLKPTAVRQVRSNLRLAASLLSEGRQDEESYRWQDVTVDHMERLCDELRRGRSASGARGGGLSIRNRTTMMCLLSSVRGVLRAAYDLGLMPADDYIAARDVRLGVPHGYRPPEGEQEGDKRERNLLAVGAGSHS